MSYSNKDLISQGYPKSALLPGTSYWRKRKSFASSTSILNWDNVKTNTGGSRISLAADKEFYGELGSISFGVGTVRMSQKKDTWSVVCTNPSLSSEGDAFSLRGINDVYMATSGATLDLGNGNNKITAGIGTISWDTGIRVGSQASLLSGRGKDRISARGKVTGIYVGGEISTGKGSDMIEGFSNQTQGIIISESGRIDMGSGNDRLVGTGTIDDLSGWTIYSNGWIEMGDGDDEITGTSFMINGAQAYLSMGAGDDRLVATLHRSNAPISFGSGIDRLFLPSGAYNISDLGDGFFSLSSTGEKEGMYGAERISGLEVVVSQSTGAEYIFTPGILNIF